jgi:glycine/D-amino acid oxidase-like deaminating enzyme
MNGIKFAPITGKLVAQIISAQRPVVDTRPFRPDRFG